MIRLKAGASACRGAVAAGLSLAALLAASGVTIAGPVCIENATIEDLQSALTGGSISSVDLVRGYIARIEAYDRAGPT